VRLNLYAGLGYIYRTRADDELRRGVRISAAAGFLNADFLGYTETEQSSSSTPVRPAGI
jgi:hypothetical protein